jgi:hypothetical protein
MPGQESREVGARGKKRRRADGTIAGKPKQGGIGYSGAPAHEELESVPLRSLAAAIEISRRYVPLDDGAVADWDWESEFEEIEALATKEGVDRESLAIRAEKLVDLLRKPGGEQLYTLDGTNLVIDDVLLEFAATTPIDTSNKPLIWPRPGADAEGLPAD